MDYFNIFFTNKIVLSVFVAVGLAHLIKFIVHSINEKKPIWVALVASGGMPSSHTSLVTGLAAAVGIVEGISTLFIAVLFFALIIMRDAFGARRSIDKQANIINEMIDYFKAFTRKRKKEVFHVHNIKGRTGHEPIEVFAGIVVGIFSVWLVWVLF